MLVAVPSLAAMAACAQLHPASEKALCSMRRPRGCSRARCSAQHPQSAVGAGLPAAAAAAASGGEQAAVAAGERGGGSFRFWYDERRFKGSADGCLVQAALFAAGGVRTGGYPKAAPVPGPLGHQRGADWDLLWSPARSALCAVQELKPGQLASAVPGMYSLTKKRRLAATLSAAYGRDTAWRIVPQSYSLPVELGLWRSWLDEQRAAGADPGPWMLKTAQHLGRGLSLLPGEAAYEAAQRPRLPSAKPFVLAQRYVADPLLILGRKFGLRLWLLVTGVDPFTCYLHSKGLVLFSTDSYDAGSLGAAGDGSAGRGHVTNYGMNVNGTVWALDGLREHIGAEAFGRLWSRLVSSAALVACAAMGEARAEHARGQVPPHTTFELLGLDYLVDQGMHPWLLEVNGTPSLAVDHSDAAVERLIRDTKGGMVEDMVELLGCGSRFLARYGLERPGVKLPLPAARRRQAALAVHDDGAARRRVAGELRRRGGFLPLMGHPELLQHAAAGGGAGQAAEAAGPEAPAGLDFSERDRLLFAQMQPFWQQQQQKQHHQGKQEEQQQQRRRRGLATTAKQRVRARHAKLVAPGAAAAGAAQAAAAAGEKS